MQYLIHFHHYDLSSLALIPAHTLCQNLLIFKKFQVQKCKSFIRDTKDFLIKLSSIKNIPENSFLVTMDVSALYTNIDHEEDADASFK